jgi:hypothetical protein
VGWPHRKRAPHRSFESEQHSEATPRTPQPYNTRGDILSERVYMRISPCIDTAALVKSRKDAGKRLIRILTAILSKRSIAIDAAVDFILYLCSIELVAGSLGCCSATRLPAQKVGTVGKTPRA